MARTTAKLVGESELAVVHAPNLVRQQLNKIPIVWQHGHISVQTLWDLYATHPYLPRLRDRSVLEAGVADALSHPIAWEQSVFALADSYDETSGRYDGLRLPGDDVGLFSVTGSTLLVRPEVAIAQREADLAASRPTTEPQADDDPAVAGPGQVDVPPGPGTPTWTGGTTGRPAPPRPAAASKRRFFGSRVLRSDRPAADFAKLQDEVLAHLAAVPGVQLEVRLEVSAIAPDGFSDATVRTVGENANTLRFEQSGFEEI